ncbi:MAG TPA: MFS transporter [Planctomycetota bacterium]|nr:MFS transporter [Planctomycetota bacterium]
MGEPGSAANTPCEHRLVTPRLSVMFFLQWATWGVYAPLMGRCYGASVAEGGLGFSEWQIGLLFGLPGTLGALLAPLIGGQLSDRYFSAERLLGVFQIAIGAILWTLPTQKLFSSWLVLTLLISLMSAPTVSLANALAFAHLPDPKAQYARARLWGTIGWIVAGWGFAMIWLQTGLVPQWLPPFLKGTEAPDVTQRLFDAIRAGAVLSVAFGLYSLSLPRTPPKRKGVDPLAFRKAFRLFRFRSFAVLMVTGFVVAAIHNIYFMQTSKFLPTLGLRQADILPAMSVGQFAEIFVMAILGWMLKRLGFRWVLAIGAFAYALRFAIFGTTWLPLGVIVASQSLHGVCFACFIAAAFIYIDHLADKDIRASAQSLIGLALGLGPILGGVLSGKLAGLCTPPGGTLNFSPYWYTLSAIGLAATLFFVIFFRDESAQRAAEDRLAQ